jgi:hypothetical protein
MSSFHKCDDCGAELHEPEVARAHEQLEGCDSGYFDGTTTFSGP